MVEALSPLKQIPRSGNPERIEKWPLFPILCIHFFSSTLKLPASLIVVGFNMLYNQADYQT